MSDLLRGSNMPQSIKYIFFHTDASYYEPYIIGIQNMGIALPISISVINDKNYTLNAFTNS